MSKFYKLAQPKLSEFRTADRPISEFGFLAVAEQCAIDRKLARSDAETDELPKQLDIPAHIAHGTSEALYFFDSLAGLLRESQAAKHVLETGSRIDLLKSPICYFEFRQKQDDYVSLLHVPGGTQRSPHDLQRALTAYVDYFSAERPETRVDDESLATSLRGLFASKPTTLFASVAASAEQHFGRPEVQSLGEALVEHIRQNHLGSAASQSGYADQARESVVNTFTRASIRTWTEELEEFSAVPAEAGSAKEAPNCYPFVALETLDASGDLLVAFVVSALDQWFVDERVRSDRRLPTVLVAVFDISTSMYHTRRDLEPLNDALAPRIAALSHRLTGFRRGQALANAAGDASKVTQFWFGEGVAGLLATDADAGAFEVEDPLDFWNKFVTDLLCAKIPGVGNTETFPFDRALIFRGAPSNAHLVSQQVDMRVLETALQSTAVDSRFQFLTSLQRNRNDLNDLNYSDKIVKYDMSVVVRPGAAPNSVSFEPQRLRNSKARNLPLAESSSVDSHDSDREKSDCDVILKGLLAFQLSSAGNVNPEESLREAEELQRQARKKFDHNGFFFEFKSGINLDSELPFLNALSELYVETLSDEHSTLDATLEPREIKRNRDDIKLISPDSKVITISYDPTLIQSNRRSAGINSPDKSTLAARQGVSGANNDQYEDEYYVSPDEAFTLILIANVAPERGMHEVWAERDNLKLLLTLILSQKMRDRRREAQLLDRRVEVLSVLLQALLHRVRNAVEDPVEKAAIQNNAEGMKQAIQFDRKSLSSIKDCTEPAFYFSRIWTKGEGQTDQGPDELVHSIQGYVDNHRRRLGLKEAVSVRLSLAPLPKLELRLPLTAVHECVTVVLNNAVEAACAPGAPAPREIVISQVAYSIGERWIYEIVVENSCARIPASVWNALTADEPSEQGVNQTKKTSSGKGIFAARKVLRIGLGSSADIKYQASTSGRVVARICLPAKVDESLPQGFLIDDAAAGVLPKNNTVPTVGGRVLYVEDAPKILREGVEFLRARLGEGAVDEAVSLEGASRIVQRGLPALLITDLAFPDADTGSKKAKEANGAQLVSYCAAKSKEAGGMLPPIWIVSGHDRESVLSRIRETNPSPESVGYSVADARCSPADLMRPGVLAVLPHKRLSDVQGLDVALDIFSSGKLSMSGRSLDLVPPNLAPELTLFHANPSEVSLRGNIARAHAALRKDRTHAPRDILIVRAERDLSVAENLRDWFALPPLRDTDALEGFSQPTPLTSASRHSNVVFVLPPERTTNLSPPVRYWLLWHNVVCGSASSDELARAWAALKNESGGPIRLLRHDARNISITVDSPSALNASNEVAEVSKLIDESLAVAPTELALLSTLNECGTGQSLDPKLREMFEGSVRGEVAAESLALRARLIEMQSKVALLGDAVSGDNAASELMQSAKLSCDAMIFLLS